MGRANLWNSVHYQKLHSTCELLWPHGLLFVSPNEILYNFANFDLGARVLRAEWARDELRRQLLACKMTVGWPVQRLIDQLEISWESLPTVSSA